MNYVGTPNLSTSITIPVDGDNANAASVNVSATALQDMTTFLLQEYGQIMQSTAPIRVKQVTNTTMTVGPIPLILVQEVGIWKSLTKGTFTVVTVPTDVEGGATFQKNRTYYLYAYSDAGVIKFQLSLTIPDIFFLYKLGGFTHKFLCSVRSDPSTDNVIPYFSKYGNQVTVNLPTAFAATTLPGSDTTIGLENVLPLALSGFPVKVKLLMQINSNSIAENIIKITGESGTQGIIYLVGAGVATTIMVDMTTDSFNRVFVAGASADPQVQISIFLIGYQE